MKNILLNKVKDKFIKDGKLTNRYYHTIGVMDKAIELNRHHQLNVDENELLIACAFHDIAKYLSKEESINILNKHYSSLVDELLDYPTIWHSFTGAIVAKEEYGILNDSILNAIKYHTTGKPNMSDLEKLVFLSDYIEEKTRIGECFEDVRKLAYQNIDLAIIKMIEQTIEYLEVQKLPIHRFSKETYHYYLKEGKKDV